MLKRLFQKDANFDIDNHKDEIAKLLKVDTQALKEFEEKYKSTSLNEIDDNFFKVNSKQASQIRKERAATEGDQIRFDWCASIIW